MTLNLDNVATKLYRALLGEAGIADCVSCAFTQSQCEVKGL